MCRIFTRVANFREMAGNQKDAEKTERKLRPLYGKYLEDVVSFIVKLLGRS